MNVQRFGRAVSLNVHVLVLDGVFARAADARLRFHRGRGGPERRRGGTCGALTAGLEANNHLGCKRPSPARRRN